MKDTKNWDLFKKTVTYKFIGIIISYIIVLMYYGEASAWKFTALSTSVFTVYYVLFEKFWDSRVT